jgi:hypothetical protein
MNFKFLNMTITLPVGATQQDASDIEAAATAFITSTGLAGTMSFDVSQDVPAAPVSPAPAAP